MKDKIALPIPTLGEQPQVEDLSYYRSLSDVFSRAKLKDNPLWNDDLELQYMRSYSYTLPINPIQGQLNDRIAKRFPVSDLNRPRDSVAVLQTAIRYAYENPFVAKATRIKTDFTCQDFEHRTLNETVKDFYDEEVDRLNVEIIHRHIVWHLYAIGIVPIWWGGEETRQIKFIELLDPRMCHIEYNFGHARLFLKIDEKMRQAVNDPEGKMDVRNKWRYESMPKYWIKQIEDQKNIGQGRGFIELQEGSYTVLENRYTSLNRVVGELDGLPLQPAFDALQQYRLLQAGDFATAWQLKNMITLVSEGDPKAEGDRYRPVTAQRLANLQAQFQRPDSAFTVYCDPTTKVEFIIPPVDKIFGTDKYLQREKEIKEILNIPSFMWVSEGSSNFSNATNELKLLQMEVQSIREIVEQQFFKPFYRRLRAQVARPGFKVSDIVYPTFSNTNLQDAANLQKNAGELYSRGAISLKSFQEMNGFDHDYEMAQKQKEFNEYGPSDKSAVVNDTIARPLYEASQGNMQVDRNKGGNPGTSSTGDRKPSSSTRTPRTRK